MDTAPTPAPDRPRIPRSAWIATPTAIAMVVAARGAVLAKLWAWFVVPLGVPYISWLHACGLTLVFRALERIEPDPKPTEREPLTGSRVIGRAVFSCTLLAITLAVGAAVAALR